MSNSSSEARPSKPNPYADKKAYTGSISESDDDEGSQLRLELDANYAFAKSAAKKREKKVGPRDPKVKRRGLVIGCDYPWLPMGKGGLNGCSDDAEHFKELLVKNYGFKDADVTLMTDRPLAGRDLEKSGPWSMPTVPTIRRVKDALRGIVQDMSRGDCMVIYFAGHGTNVRDEEGEELDGQDQVLCLPDRAEDMYMVTLKDDWLYENVVKALPSGCKLTAIFDCCHSGGALDLNWEMDTRRNDKNGNLKFGKWKDVMSKKNAEVNVDATLISGCRNNESAIETIKDQRLLELVRRGVVTGERGGMLTTEIIKILSRKPYDHSYQTLMADTAYEVFKNTKFSGKDTHPQLPVLSSSLQFVIAERKFGFDETTGIWEYTKPWKMEKDRSRTPRAT